MSLKPRPLGQTERKELWLAEHKEDCGRGEGTAVKSSVIPATTCPLLVVGGGPSILGLDVGRLAAERSALIMCVNDTWTQVWGASFIVTTDLVFGQTEARRVEFATHPAHKLWVQHPRDDDKAIDRPWLRLVGLGQPDHYNSGLAAVWLALRMTKREVYCVGFDGPSAGHYSYELDLPDNRRHGLPHYDELTENMRKLVADSRERILFLTPSAYDVHFTGGPNASPMRWCAKCRLPTTTVTYRYRTESGESMVDECARCGAVR